MAFKKKDRYSGFLEKKEYFLRYFKRYYFKNLMSFYFGEDIYKKVQFLLCFYGNNIWARKWVFGKILKTLENIFKEKLNSICFRNLLLIFEKTFSKGKSHEHGNHFLVKINPMVSKRKFCIHGVFMQASWVS